MATKIITVANQKGGVAKTTTCATIAHGLAIEGKEVLVIDIDPQGQCSTLLGMRQEPGTFNLLVAKLPYKAVIRFTGRDYLWLIPGNAETSTAQAVMAVQRAPINAFREVLKPVLSSGFDYVIIDTAPSVGDLQAQALWAADYVLIPSACEFASAEGVFKLVNTLLGLMEEYHWTGELLGVLPTFYDDQTRESQASKKNLDEHFTDAVLSPIHRATVLRECMALGQTIFEIDRDCRAAEEYRALVNHILKVTR
jgi:chromosome partitioning protein